MLVGKRMSARLFTVGPQTTIGEALGITRAQRIRHLPVVEEDRLVGVVTERDLRLAAPAVWDVQADEVRDALRTRTVGEVMATSVHTVEPGTPIEDAAKLFYEKRIGCLPVLSEGRLVGILTRADLLRALVELFGANHALARLEIRMPNRAGELARVVRVIGIEHKVNISGLIVPPVGNTEQTSTAIVQLQTTNPLPIIEALRKLGYQVGWPAIDLDPDSGDDGLSESTRGVQPRNRIPIEQI